MREIWAKKLWLLKSSLEHQMDKDQSLRKSTYNAFQMSVTEGQIHMFQGDVVMHDHTNATNPP